MEKQRKERVLEWHNGIGIVDEQKEVIVTAIQEAATEIVGRIRTLEKTKPELMQDEDLVSSFFSASSEKAYNTVRELFRIGEAPAGELSEELRTITTEILESYGIDVVEGTVITPSEGTYRLILDDVLRAVDGADTPRNVVTMLTVLGVKCSTLPDWLKEINMTGDYQTEALI